MIRRFGKFSGVGSNDFAMNHFLSPCVTNLWFFEVSTSLVVTFLGRSCTWARRDNPRGRQFLFLRSPDYRSASPSHSLESLAFVETCFARFGPLLLLAAAETFSDEGLADRMRKWLEFP
jgi:hypothetical protein